MPISPTPRSLLFIIPLMTFSCIISYGQEIRFQGHSLEAVSVSVTKETIMGKESLRVIKDTSIQAVDEPTFARLTGINFHNGVIEVKVLSKLLANAPAYARAFIGVAFRIDDQNKKYESIYIRPLNARVDDQVRRNHSIQYYSYPDHKFDRLRRESPEKYESYADMEMNKWITLRIEVKDAGAMLFIGNNVQPSLVVTDLKMGNSASGSIGLWVDVGTEGYFTDLQIKKY
ncbi:MAG: hypothetical protein ABWZ25_12965 [Chitinophagaceae bacterium]